eukprot:NODE_25316_length_591_cov_6.778017.p1 GENE.NODE_25316_length_591_cov_6.778017~~NODE_25316_length_591_cov_6.778017.p1  ORF type:complete len:153 (-),score=50.73 NODE_25316_length_591_cov_6.778017:132-590(-)
MNHAPVKTLKDMSAEDFIKHFSQHLKRQGKLLLPPWADIVKTGKHKELAPYDPDWIYVRAASLIRRLYTRGNTGVGTFKKAYGGQKRRGTCTNTFSKSSGKIIRYLLQQLEAEPLRYIETEEGCGRKLTKDGQREVDQVCSQAAAAEEEEEE